MLELNGKYSSAKVFTDVVDQIAISQIIELCNQPMSAGSQIRIMPDVHAGAGCTIPLKKKMHSCCCAIE